MANARWLQSRREEAWADGRELRDHLLRQYQARYSPEVLPPPALIVRELLSDIIGVRLFFDPMPLDRFAEIRMVEGRPRVTVNADIAQMEGVKDAEGVANVAMWHEVMHVERDAPDLVAPASAVLDGFEQPPDIVCYRSPNPSLRADAAAREFWAEEAGRAAAVSFEALRRTEAFVELISLAGRNRGHVRSAWPLLYRAAEAIGVNGSALVKQLTFEGMIAVEGRGTGSQVFLQAPLLELGS